MKRLYDFLVRVSNAIFFVEKWLLLFSVIIAVMVNFINVIMRYVFRTGISSCEMLSVVMFMFMVIIGGNIAIKSDSEIRIDIYQPKDPKKRAAFRLISDIVSIAALLLGVIGLVATVQAVMINKQKVTPLPIYTYHIYIMMLIGFILMLLDHVIIFVQHLGTIAGLEMKEGPKTE